MSTDAEREDKALQYSVEEYKQLWEVLRGLEQDRRYIWTFLTLALLGLPGAAAGLAGREGLEALRDDYAPAVAAFLTVLWLVGLLGFMHLIHLRKQMVEYMREINRIRGFWLRQGVPLAQPSKLLHRCDDRPHFLEPTGGSMWFALSIAVMVSFVFALTCMALAGFSGTTWAVRSYALAFLAFLAVMIAVYCLGMRVACRDYSEWQEPPQGKGSRWGRFSWWVYWAIVVLLLCLLVACAIRAGASRASTRCEQEQRGLARAAHPRHDYGHPTADEHRSHHSGHLPEQRAQ